MLRHRGLQALQLRAGAVDARVERPPVVLTSWTRRLERARPAADVVPPAEQRLARRSGSVASALRSFAVVERELAGERVLRDASPEAEPVEMPRSASWSIPSGSPLTGV